MPVDFAGFIAIPLLANQREIVVAAVEKGSSSGVERLEAVLGGVLREDVEGREKEALEDFNCWGKERDGTIGGRYGERFPRLRDGDDPSNFPDSGNDTRSTSR